MTKDNNKRINQHEDLKKRFDNIIKLAEGRHGGVDRANEVEEMLIKELRGFGQEVLKDWGEHKAQREVETYRKTHAESTIHKKKTQNGEPYLESSKSENMS